MNSGKVRFLSGLLTEKHQTIRNSKLCQRPGREERQSASDASLVFHFFVCFFFLLLYLFLFSCYCTFCFFCFYSPWIYTYSSCQVIAAFTPVLSFLLAPRHNASPPVLAASVPLSFTPVSPNSALAPVPLDVLAFFVSAYCSPYCRYF